MRVALVALLFAASASAQAPSERLPAACGPEKVTFNVTVDETQHAPAQAESGKAQVYFIQDNGLWGDYQHYTLKIGMDGVWVGAYKDNSYLSLSVGPGEHHVCANVQSKLLTGQLVALVHLIAEPGKVYYIRTRLLGGITQGYPPPLCLDLDPIDSDQGKYLIASYPLSVSTQKK